MSSVEVTRLRNGLTVATHAMPHLESVAMGLWIGAGTRSETLPEHGMSHLLEHMAFKGTTRRGPRELAETIEAVGGEMNAETSADHTVYYLRLLKEDLALGVDVLGDIVTDPLFDGAELEREKHVIIQEIGAALDVPEDLVFDRFQEAAFPGQAIGRSILGTPDSIRAHSREGLRRFLGQHYCGSQMVLAAAGSLDHAEVVHLAERHLGSLPPDAPVPPDPGIYRGGEHRQPQSLQEAQIVIGFEAPSYADPRFTAAHILSGILGGGMASRLFQEIRENRGLCYSIYSFYSPFSDTGILGVHAATSEEDVGELMPVLLDELAKLTDGVSDAELLRAKAQLRAGLLMTLESPIARAGQIARHILIHGRPLPLEELVEKVEAVSAADLVALAADVLGSATTLAAIGPVAALPAATDIHARLGGQRAAVGW